MKTQIHKTVGTPTPVRVSRDAPVAGYLSYKTMTLGLVLVVGVAAVTQFVRSHGRRGDLGLSRQAVDVQRVEESELPGNPVSANPGRFTAATATNPATSSRPGGTDSQSAMERLEDVVQHAGPREQATAAALRHFLVSRDMAELRQLDRNDVVALVDHLAGELSPENVGLLLQQTLGLSPTAALTDEDIRSSMVDIYDAIAGNAVTEVRPSVLTVTDAADPDGRITGDAHTLPAGTRRVYAVFENAHALEGLEQVMAVWRDPNDDQLVFTEFEPIRQGSAYNYVWLDVDAGWPAGRYQVELFHPEAQSLLLASEGFSIR